MKFIKNNMDIIVVLFIVLFIFTTLVVFYEDKLVKLKNEKCNIEDNSLYLPNEKGIIEYNFSYMGKLSEKYVKLKDDYDVEIIVKLDSDIINELEQDEYYSMFLKANLNDKYDSYNIQKIISRENIYRILKVVRNNNE